MLCALLLVAPAAMVRSGSAFMPAVTAPVARAQPLMTLGMDGPRKVLASAIVAAGLAASAPAIAAPADISLPSTSVAAISSEFKVDEEELRPEQRKYLEERSAKPQVTEYEKQVEGTYKKKEVTEGGKFKYSTVVVGLLVISVAAPMAQFFYYVKEEDE